MFRKSIGPSCLPSPTVNPFKNLRGNIWKFEDFKTRFRVFCAVPMEVFGYTEKAIDAFVVNKILFTVLNDGAATVDFFFFSWRFIITRTGKMTVRVWKKVIRIFFFLCYCQDKTLRVQRTVRGGDVRVNVRKPAAGRIRIVHMGSRVSNRTVRARNNNSCLQHDAELWRNDVFLRP